MQSQTFSKALGQTVALTAFAHQQQQHASSSCGGCSGRTAQVERRRFYIVLMVAIELPFTLQFKPQSSITNPHTRTRFLIKSAPKSGKFNALKSAVG
jgi:hypothetical protein